MLMNRRNQHEYYFSAALNVSGIVLTMGYPAMITSFTVSKTLFSRGEALTAAGRVGASDSL